MPKYVIVVCIVLVFCLSTISAAQIRDDVKGKMEEDERYAWVPVGENVIDLEYKGHFGAEGNPDPKWPTAVRFNGENIYVHDADSGLIFIYDLNGVFQGYLSDQPVQGKYTQVFDVDGKGRAVIITGTVNWHDQHFFDGNSWHLSLPMHQAITSCAIIGDSIFTTVAGVVNSKSHLFRRYEFDGSAHEWIGKNEHLFMWSASFPLALTARDSTLTLAGFHAPQVTFFDTQTQSQNTITINIPALVHRAEDNIKNWNRFAHRQGSGVRYAQFMMVFIAATWIDDYLYLATHSYSRAEELGYLIILAMREDQKDMRFYRYIRESPMPFISNHNIQIMLRDDEIHVIAPFKAPGTESPVLGYLGPLHIDVPK